MQGSKLLLVIGVTLVASVAYGHVRIQPVQSQQAARQTYTIRVPTEGKTATSWVEVEVPDGVSIVSAAGPAETKKTGDRIVSIRWTAEIPPGESREFIFEATNPDKGGEIIWKAHQHFEDGSSSDWVEAPSSAHPAPVTKLGPAKP